MDEGNYEISFLITPDHDAPLNPNLPLTYTVKFSLEPCIPTFNMVSSSFDYYIMESK